MGCGLQKEALGYEQPDEDNPQSQSQLQGDLLLQILFSSPEDDDNDDNDDENYDDDDTVPGRLYAAESILEP